MLSQVGRGEKRGGGAPYIGVFIRESLSKHCGDRPRRDGFCAAEQPIKVEGGGDPGF